MYCIICVEMYFIDGFCFYFFLKRKDKLCIVEYVMDFYGSLIFVREIR